MKQNLTHQSCTKQTHRKKKTQENAQEIESLIYTVRNLIKYTNLVFLPNV